MCWSNLKNPPTAPCRLSGLFSSLTASRDQWAVRRPPKNNEPRNAVTAAPPLGVPGACQFFHNSVMHGRWGGLTPATLWERPRHSWWLHLCKKRISNHLGIPQPQDMDIYAGRKEPRSWGEGMGRCWQDHSWSYLEAAWTQLGCSFRLGCWRPACKWLTFLCRFFLCLGGYNAFEVP